MKTDIDNQVELAKADPFPLESELLKHVYENDSERNKNSIIYLLDYTRAIEYKDSFFPHGVKY